MAYASEKCGRPANTDYPTGFGRAALGARRTLRGTVASIAARARWRRLPALALIASLAAWSGLARAQTCVGDCSNDGFVRVNELIVGVNIALEAADLSECPSLDSGDGTVTVDRLIIAVNNALHGCGENPTPGTPTPTTTGPATTPTVTPNVSVSMWIVDSYEVTSSDCAGLIEDQVLSGVEAQGSDFTVRQSGDQVEIEDSEGLVFDGTVDPDGTIHVQRTTSDSIVTCDYDVDVDASANLSNSPTTATYLADVNLSGFCLGFSDCSLEITARWRRVEG